MIAVKIFFDVKAHLKQHAGLNTQGHSPGKPAGKAIG
jgi:hypothetical protein